MMGREPREFIVLGFGSTHDALSAEALLRDLGMQVVPVPAPKELGVLCGIALRLEPSDVPRAHRGLADASINWTAEVQIRDV